MPQKIFSLFIRHQFFMASVLHNTSAVKHQNLIAEPAGCQSVTNIKSCFLTRFAFTVTAIPDAFACAIFADKMASNVILPVFNSVSTVINCVSSSSMYVSARSTSPASS